MSYLILRQQRILENLNTHKIAAGLLEQTLEKAQTRVFILAVLPSPSGQPSCALR
jgi:hypothetical protein